VLAGGVAAQVPARKLLFFPQFRHGRRRPDAPPAALVFGEFRRFQLLRRDHQLAFQSCAVVFQVGVGFFQIFPALLYSLNNVGHREAGEGGVRVALTLPRDGDLKIPDVLLQGAPHPVKRHHSALQFIHLESFQVQKAASVQSRDSPKSGLFMHESV
jgi:hypothetical protein